MTETSSFISILSTIGFKLNGALAVSNNPKHFNDHIGELDKLRETLNAFIVEKNNERKFDEEEKELLKNIQANNKDEELKKQIRFLICSISIFTIM